MPLNEQDWSKFRKREATRRTAHHVSDMLDGYCRARAGERPPAEILWRRVFAAIGLLVVLVSIGGCIVSCIRH